MRKVAILLAMLVSVVTWETSTTHAQISHLLRYQGTLVDTQDIPLEGPYALTFRMYDSETGGSLLWGPEVHPSVPVTKGTFSVLLGSIQPMTVPFDIDCYLAIEVNSDGQMSPRQRITPVATAMRAEVAERLEGVITTTPSGFVGVGTEAPQHLLHLYKAGDTAGLVIEQGTANSNLDAGVFFKEAGATKWTILEDADEIDKLKIASSTGGEVVTLQQDGNVGIGTTTPLERLHLSSGSNTYLSLASTGANTLGNGIRFLNNTGSSAGYFQVVPNTVGSNSVMEFYVGGGSIADRKMVIHNGGNVGIGTTAPTQKLDVAGYVHASGYYTGDLIFQKEGTPLWRMYEEEDGLYLESLVTNRRYRLLMEAVLENSNDP